MLRTTKLFSKISSVRRDLWLNGFPHDFIGSDINFGDISSLNKEEKPLSPTHISHMKKALEEFGVSTYH
jgi:hypothetical protein